MWKASLNANKKASDRFTTQVLQLPEAVQTVSDTIVKISLVDICVDTFSALIKHFLYEMLFGRYCIMCSAKKDLYKQVPFLWEVEIFSGRSEGRQ